MAKVKAASGDTIRYALDSISVRKSQAISAAVIGPSGGKVVHLLAVDPSATDRTDIERICKLAFIAPVWHWPVVVVPRLQLSVLCTDTIIYSSLGRAYTYATGQGGPAVPEDRVHMVQFLKKVPELVREGKVKPLPVKLWKGGLDAIPQGLRYMKEGRVSGEKIVYRVS